MKINKTIKKELLRATRTLKREQRRCARLYPDWRDDEFNMLDYKFIWGFTKGARTTIPSFYTWEDFYIYYNRADKRYYYHIDTGVYQYIDTEAAWHEVERLCEINEAFQDFLIENGHLMRKNICCEDLHQEGAETLSELYVKFRVMCEGYKWYVENKPQD